MKRITLFLCTLLGIFYSVSALSANLLDVYQQAFHSDPVFRQADAQHLSDDQKVPIAFSSLLPAVALTGSADTSKHWASGSASLPGKASARGYTVNLDISQVLFDYEKFMSLANAYKISNKANATYTLATQELMLRVAKAYFQVLEDEDTLRFAISNRRVLFQQLDEVRERFQVGLKTQTEVATAKGAYDAAVADYISAKTMLANDNENLRAITGHRIQPLSTLSENFPLVMPNPANIDTWSQLAEQHNGSVIVNKYSVAAARDHLKQQYAGHLPTVNIDGQLSQNFTHGIRNAGVNFEPGSTSRLRNEQVTLNLTVPIFSGMGVVAKTKAADYDYQVATQLLEKARRDSVNAARQAYLGVMAGISKINADKQIILSTNASLQGMRARYRVGTQTLVDVLNEQTKVFQAQKQYAVDRYQYVNNILELKKAAGSLNVKDLIAINRWLTKT